MVSSLSLYGNQFLYADYTEKVKEKIRTIRVQKVLIAEILR